MLKSDAEGVEGFGLLALELEEEGGLVHAPDSRDDEHDAPRRHGVDDVESGLEPLRLVAVHIDVFEALNLLDPVSEGGVLVLLRLFELCVIHFVDLVGARPLVVRVFPLLRADVLFAEHLVENAGFGGREHVLALRG